MPDNPLRDLLAQLEKTTHALEALSPNDPPARWGGIVEPQAEVFWQLYRIQHNRRFLEQALKAYESAAYYYRDGAEIHFAAIQRRLQNAYTDMARYDQPTAYLYKARDAGIEAQSFYARHNTETRDIHFEILGLQTQILTALALLETYMPYGEEAIYMGKYIINETRNDADMLAQHIEGHRVLGKAYIGLSRMMEYGEAREYLLEATRILGKVRRFTHQAEGADSMLRSLLLMAFTYMDLERLENNPDYLPPALRALQQAMQVNETVDDPLIAAVTYYTISLLYEQMEKPAQVAESAAQSAAYYRETGISWMASMAALRAWYFEQGIIIRGIMLPVIILSQLPIMLHRRAILPYVLA